MDVSRIAPPEAATVAAIAATTADATVAATAIATAETAATMAGTAARGAPAPGAAPGVLPDAGPGSKATAAAGLADRVDIGPLHLAAALRILLSEVRVEFGLPPASVQDSLAVPPLAQTQAPTSPTQAVQQLLHLLLRALPADDPPDDPAPLAWAAATLRAQATLQLAVDRAVEAVGAWRDVPATVVDAAKETRTLMIVLLNDEPPSPLWFRPEWLELAPRVQWYWRRRRRARRAFSDPDLPGRTPHDAEEPAP